jgi:hypothetical protein
MLAESRIHLKEAGEGYFDHLRFAALVGSMLLGAGLACILHALVPALCTRTASRIVERLTGLFKDRSTLPRVAQQSSGALVFVLLFALSVPTAASILLLAHWMIAAPMALLSLGVLAAFLWTNPGLDAVD